MTKTYNFAFHKQVKEAASPWDEDVSYGVVKGHKQFSEHKNPEDALEAAAKMGPGHEIIRWVGKTETHAWDHTGKLIEK